MICLTPKPTPFFVYCIQIKDYFFYRKRAFLGKVSKKLKEDFLTALATVIKKDPTTTLKKRVNELKVHENTVGTAINKISAQTLTPFITLHGRFS